MEYEKVKGELKILIEKEQKTKDDMRQLIFDYLKQENRLSKNCSIIDIVYRQIIREEFGLVL